MTVQVLNYTFDGLYTSTALVRNLSGVYVIADCGHQGNSLLDVGESGTLQHRINTHDREECWRRHCKGTIKAAVIYTDMVRRKIIADEIRAGLNPTCGVR